MGERVLSVLTASINFRARGRSGKHMLTLSSSQFDPKLSSEPTAAHCFALLQSATFIHAKTLHTIAVGLKQEGANRETKDSDRCPAPISHSTMGI
jgi:hypothetical protein